ncbi:MAG: hypothetical protein HY291_00025 [Planctomycetes bacterium]|nr:hypothetical protein [Planctomycetota bacterium]
MSNTSRLSIRILGTEKPADFEIAPADVPAILEAIGTNKKLDLIKPRGDKVTINLFYVTLVDINDASNRQAPGQALNVRIY